MANKFLLTTTAVLMGSMFALAQGQGNQQAPPAEKVPPAAKNDRVKPSKTNQPVTGKTGQHGTEVDVTTTGSTGVETPGALTDTGVAQQPGKQTTSRQPPVIPAPHRGAPPNWEQVGQEPNLADNSAAAASRAEIGSAEGTLGVNGVMPAPNASAPAKDQSKSKTKKAGTPQTPQP